MLSLVSFPVSLLIQRLKFQAHRIAPDFNDSSANSKIDPMEDLYHDEGVSLRADVSAIT